ncbi:MAG: penicillin-binding protein 2 [Chloroflexota bacterium]
MSDGPRVATSRRRVLRLALAAGTAAISLSACSSLTRAMGQFTGSGVTPTTTVTTASSTSTSATTATTTAGTPAPVATPVNVPGAVAAAFLTAWNEGRYADMYPMISADAQGRITKDAFAQRYIAITEQATITKVTAALAPGQRPDANLQQFAVSFETVLVGKLNEQNTITLGVDPNGREWKVQWLPSLIFKELTGDNLIHMYPHGTPRGDIRDRAGTPLATVGQVTTVYLAPSEVKDEAALLTQLSQLLAVPQAVIKQQYAQTETNARVPIKTLSLAAAAPIRAKLAAIPAIRVVDEPARVYPHGPLAAHAIGYISDVTADDLRTLAGKGYRPGDVVGRVGIEQWGESDLAGQWGGTLMVITPKSDPVTTIAQREPNKAGNIVLTIDMALQQRCEELLGKRAGSIGVMRVSDGSLLALASYPSFDPNQFVLGISTAAYNALVNDPLKPFLNRLVEGFYPTGSVFKPITMAAAIDHAGYNEQSMFTCPGSYTLGDTTWHCWLLSGHGRLGLVSALTQSCDVAFYTMGHQEDTTNPMLLPDETKAFGLGSFPQIVGLGSPKATGTVPSPPWKQATFREGWLPGDAVNLSIGQGYLLASPLQVLNYYAALANGGMLWAPRIVDKVVGTDGQVVNANPPKQIGMLPAGQNALQLIRQGLHDVVSSSIGTGYEAFKGLAVSIAGKTGTAQAGDGLPHAWFAAYAPFEQPEIAIVAMVEHAGEGATVAAPIVRGVIEAYSTHLGEKH